MATNPTWKGGEAYCGILMGPILYLLYIHGLPITSGPWISGVAGVGVSVPVPAASAIASFSSFMLAAAIASEVRLLWPSLRA